MKEKLLKLWGAIKLAFADPYKACDQIEDHEAGPYSLKVIAPISVSIVSAFGDLSYFSDQIKSTYAGTTIVELIELVPGGFGLLDFVGTFFVDSALCVTFAALAVLPGYALLVVMHNAELTISLRRFFNYVTYNCFVWMAVAALLAWALQFSATAAPQLRSFPEFIQVYFYQIFIVPDSISTLSFVEKASAYGLYFASIIFSAMMYCRLSGKLVYSIGLATAGFFAVYVIPIAYILLLYRHTRILITICTGAIMYIIGASFVFLLPFTALVRWRWHKEIPNGWIINSVRYLKAKLKSEPALPAA